MSLALKFGDISDPKSLQGVLYFNTVTDFTREYGGKVTEHPIELGAYISDHFISQNPRIKISGVLSDIDFTNIPSNMRSIDGIDFVNKYDGSPSAVSVNDIGSNISRFLPGVVTQYLDSTPPSVQVDQSVRGEFNMSVENFMRDLINGVSYDEEKQRYFNKMTTATLFELVGESFPVFLSDNLVVTSFNIKEDADSGDGLFFDISLEKVTFVSLQKADAPKPRTSDQRKVSKTENKGNQKTSDSPETPKQDTKTFIGTFNKGANG